MHLDLIESLRELLNEAGKIKLSENMVIVAIVLWTVKGHFKRLEEGLREVAIKVGELSVALTRVETDHSKRIGSLEDDVTKLKTRIFS